MTDVKVELFKKEDNEELDYDNAIKKDGLYKVTAGRLPHHDYYMIVTAPADGEVMPVFLRVATDEHGRTGFFGVGPSNTSHWRGARYVRTNKSLTLELKDEVN